MLYENPHPSDQELLLAADGELPQRRTAQIREHLSACWECRTRMSEIDAAIADVVRLHHRDLDPQLPPIDGARALLRAQLAQLTAASAPHRWRRLIAGSGVAYACAALVVAALAVVLLQQRSPLPGRTVLAPRASLTPGATRPVTKADVCGESRTAGVQMIPVSLQRQVFQEYGLAGVRPDAYEVDYLITPELGGADDIRNLWPQPYSSTVWNAHVKDALEDRLHQMVCAGQIDLATAQREISTNWVSAYKKYFHTNTPLSN